MLRIASQEPLQVFRSPRSSASSFLVNRIREAWLSYGGAVASASFVMRFATLLASRRVPLSGTS